MDLERWIKSYFTQLDGYYFEIGVVEEKTNRKKRKGISEEEAAKGVTNAQLMFIHENGSPLRNIPQRPVLQKTIDWAYNGFLNDEYQKAVKIYFDSGFNLSSFENALKKTAIRIQNHARDIIYANDGQLAPNAPETIKRKKSDAPLLDTGQLARSITCRLCKDGAPV